MVNTFAHIKIRVLDAQFFLSFRCFCVQSEIMDMESVTPKKRANSNTCTSNKSSHKKKKANKSRIALEYFTFKEEKVDGDRIRRFYSCNECDKILNGTYHTNLSSHLQQHEEIYAEIYTPNLSIEEKRLKLLLECVEMVTINARSFTHLNDSSLHSMLEEKLDELEAAGRKLNLKSPHLTEVKDELRILSGNVREKICAEVKNRPLSLMVDAVTKRGRSILGFSLQNLINGKHIVRSIGMVELHLSHTGLYLADIIVKRLKEFEINLRQIVAISTDNGSNMLKMIKEIRKMEDDKDKPKNVANIQNGAEKINCTSNTT